MDYGINLIVLATWDSCLDNSLDIIKQLKNCDIRIIDSTSGSKLVTNYQTPNIFIQQIKKAFSLIDGFEYLTYISGDAITQNWPSFVERQTEVCHNLRPFVYSPYLTFEGYPAEVVSLGTLQEDSYLDLASGTDGIVFTLHREAVLFILDFIEFLELNSRKTFQIGWGLDWAWCAFAIHSNKAILRDKKVEMFHPKGTSYNTKLAEEEFREIISLLPKFAATKEFSAIEFNKIIFKMSERGKRNPKYLLPSSIYLREPVSTII
jgi:hypothetical protein